MLKSLLLAATIFISVLFSDTAQVNRGPYLSQFQSNFSYCKPDDDPNFSLIYEDELYYYYTGDKVIRGLIYQTSPDAPITFDSRTNQACQFVLTQGFLVEPDLLIENFSIDEAWANAPECDPADGKPYLSGIYALTITGFKISKAFIDTYDSQRIRDQMQMSRFEFYADYDEVNEIIAPSEVKCPITLR